MARVRNTFWRKQIDRLVQSDNVPVIFKQYINFGFDPGEPGYGFRDNAGNIQYKNSGGSWTNIGSGGSGSGVVETIVPGTGTTVDSTDPANPIIALNASSQASLALADSAVQAGDLGAVATSNDYNDLDNLPDLSVFDEVEQYANLAAFPVTGDSTKFYLAQDTGIMYRWTGATYDVISASLALGSTSSTAHRGDHGAAAYTHSQIVTGNPHGTVALDVPFDDTGLSVTGGQTEVQGAIGALDVAVAQNTTDIGGVTTDLGTLTTKVNTVIEDSPDLASFPITGYSTAFFRALDTGIIYTWNGASYDPIGTTGGGGGGISEELAIAYAICL